jgi:hypothetical protein
VSFSGVVRSGSGTTNDLFKVGIKAGGVIGSIFTVTGALVYRDKSSSDRVSVVLAERGVYIIQVGGNSIKRSIRVRQM